MAQLIDLDGLKTFLGGVKKWISNNFLPRSGYNTYNGTIEFDEGSDAISINSERLTFRSSDTGLEIYLFLTDRSRINSEGETVWYNTLSLGNDILSEVGTPEKDFDAANKAYVDGLVTTATETEIDSIFE